MSAGTIVESILDPFAACLTKEAAAAALEFRPDAGTQARADALAELTKTGRLSEDEQREYHELIEAFDLVAILKSKARQTLKSSPELF